jgi:hypothetical protein
MHVQRLYIICIALASCSWNIGKTDLYFTWVVGRSWAERINPPDELCVPVSLFPFSPFEKVKANVGKEKDPNIMMTIMGTIEDVTEKGTSSGPILEFQFKHQTGTVVICSKIPEHIQKIKDLFHQVPTRTLCVTLFDINISSNGGLWMARL